MNGLLVPVLLILFAPLLGGLVYGFERIIRARMQRRTGPPLLQPFYDFLKLADKTTDQIPTIPELRSYWMKQCEILQEKINQLNAEQWFEKHTAVSSEDFIKEPHRNKLNIIITRTSHLQYHIGQLRLLK